ncbi:MAG: L,D-transpeptidase family protein [Planctomycetota bacterium]
MSTRRKKGLGKAPKVLLLAVVIAGLAFFFWGDPDNQPNETDAGDTPTQSIASTDLPSLGNTTNGLITAPPLPQTNRSADRTPPPVRSIKPTPAPPTRNTEPAPERQPEIKPTPKVIQSVKDLTEAMPAPKRFTSGADAATLYNRGDVQIVEGQLVEGRATLSRLLFADNLQLSPADAAAVRERLDEVNRELLWTRTITTGDTIAKGYVIDAPLSTIAIRHRVPWQLLALINNISNPDNVQAGKTIKVVQGPLHARVSKSRFVMDVYAVDAERMPVFVQSFPVGLGENTPMGNWEVIKGSKVENPDWRDELNNEYFPRDDPNNPIGEFWIAIEGLDEANRDKTGFGIHGTIEPDSIGKEESRGCVRLLNNDIELVFNMLTDHSQGSTVQIVP